MTTLLLAFLPLLAPSLLLLFAYIAVVQKNKQSAAVLNSVDSIGIFGIAIGLISGYALTQHSLLLQDLMVWEGLGFSVRQDPLSMTMFVMITLLGYIVLKFSKNYLDGDKRKGIFLARLATTIASVELLVLSGNLLQLFFFWMITSVCLHYLLVFYRHRPQAVAAARKKFIVARLGDVSLFAAMALIYMSVGTGDLEQIFNTVKSGQRLDLAMQVACVLLVFTAVLKSAQFPTHGWLIEVVETPTPVSALLHAGLLNAGPFLMVRMSYLMSQSTSASILLIAIGGFTAMFASVVFLTQPSIKVSLGYSSIAHMGFMLLICGFGVYTAAILHLVAHSFYKAHAFLSSGSVIEGVRARKLSIPKQKGSIYRVLSSIAFASLIYAFFCYVWGVHPEKDFTLMATGAIIVMGLSQIIVPTLDAKSGIKTVLMSGGMAFAVALSFFSLEQGAHHLLHTQIPVHYIPNLAIEIAVVTVVMLFGVVVFTQLMAPALKPTAWSYKLGVHLRNGLYANVYFDRLIGSLENKKFKWANLAIPEEKSTLAEETLSQYEQEFNEKVLVKH